MKKPQKSLVWRITLALACLVSLAVTLSAALTYFAYLHVQDKMIDGLIQTESNRLLKRLTRFGDGLPGHFERDMGPSMFAWSESSQTPLSTLPPALRELPAGPVHRLAQTRSTWHVVIQEDMDKRLYVLYDSIAIEQQLSDFSRALMWIVGGCAIFALLISRAVARWLVQPINLLSERLTRWVPHSSEALPLHTNEADRLMEVFNRVQDKVDASIADQREFSANLHHEIRTPLTVILSDAELMLKHCVNNPEARLQRIVASVHQINQSLESTYSLAHARFEDEALVSIHAVIDDMLESLRLEAAKANLHLVNAVSPAHTEKISRHALMIVMRNITRNAILHAAPATLVIESMEGGLQFTDTGPGIPPSEIASIFDRYFSNRRADQRDDGSEASAASISQTGLGLAIAKRVCIMQSWKLDVTSPVHNGKGTRFSLRFY